MDNNEREKYLNILKEELLPALGCTEPIALAYAASKCREILGQEAEVIEAECSANIIKNVKAVVIACNTSSSAAYDTIKDEYDFKIYPIIQCCAKIIGEMPIKRLGIFATEATIKTGVYESEIKKYNKTMEIFPQSCPNWVNIVETKGQDDSQNIKTIYEDLCRMLVHNPEKIILQVYFVLIQKYHS